MIFAKLIKRSLRFILPIFYQSSVLIIEENSLLILKEKNMKKFFILAITLFVIILPGCQSGDGGNPTEVLTNFFNAVSKKDFNAAKKYATQDSDGMLSMIEMNMSGNMQDDHVAKMFEMLQNAQIGTPVIKGDGAIIKVTDKKSGEATDFLLKKERGDWKVAFDMTTLSEMGRQKMEEHGMDMKNMNLDSLNAAMPDLKKKMDSMRQLMDSDGKND